MSRTQGTLPRRRRFPWRDAIGLASAVIFVLILLVVSLNGEVLAGMLRLH